MSTADEFREKAEECRQQSERAVSPRDKAVWLRLAELWLKMAQEADPRAPKRKQWLKSGQKKPGVGINRGFPVVLSSDNDPSQVTIAARNYPIMKTNALSRGSGWMEVEVRPFWSVGKAGEGMRIADANLTNKESVAG